MVSPKRLILSPRRLAIGLLLLSSIHLLTLTTSPTPWQDEVQIVDSGRVLLSDDQSWALNWTAAQRPVAFLNYFGPLLQDRAYRLLAPSIAGPRWSALAGALFAAWMVYRWLHARQVPPYWTAGLTALFLFDPVLVQGYRGARVDAWVIGFMVAACVAIRRSGDRALSTRRQDVQLGWGAALAVIGFFFWPSAIYLVPLLAAEVIDVRARDLTMRGGRRLLLAGTAGTAIGVTLCLLPFGTRVPAFLIDVFTSSDQYYRRDAYLDLIVPAVSALADSYRLSPMVPLIGLACAPFSRPLGFALVVTFAAMVPTIIYPHRVVYLLPLLIAMIGDTARRQVTGFAMPALRWAVTAALVWAAAISLVARPVQALLFNDARGHQQYERAADSLPELRGKRVYLDSWDFYYAGRERDWRMLHGYGDIGVEGWARTFDNLDYAIYAASKSVERQRLEQSGWVLVRELVLPAVSGPPFSTVAEPRRYFVYAAPG